MRYEFSGDELTTVRSMLPNKARGVPRGLGRPRRAAAGCGRPLLDHRRPPRRFYLRLGGNARIEETGGFAHRR